MKKIAFLVFTALVLSVFIVGCSQQQAESTQQTASSGTTATSDAEIADDMIAVDDLDADLDLSELDNLDSELADIENIFS